MLALLLFAPLPQATVEVAPAAIFPRLNAETTARLTSSLTGFVRHAESQKPDNPFVAEADRLTTAPLLRQLHGLRDRGNDAEFFVPYLSLAVRDQQELQIQLTYAGVLNGKPLVRAIVELVARETDQTFRFASPFARRTAGWHSEAHGEQTLHFRTRPDADRVASFFAGIRAFDKRLQGPAAARRAPRGDFYCVHDFAEAMHVLGLVYLSDQASRTSGALAGQHADHYLFVDACYLSPAAKVFDLHDLWHDRQRLVIAPDKIYRPIDEGAAYLYAGSWGHSWQEILRRFRKYAAAHPDADWLALYEASFNFDPRSRFSLRTDYAINALLIEWIEREQGFAPVLELLTCGPKVPGNRNYFDKLEQLTGVTRATFATKVRELLQSK